MTSRGVDRLHDLFAQEAEVRLARLSQLLLQLDEGGDADAIGEIFREVHTLKGSAAVVGFEQLSEYAHGVEERLDKVRRGSLELTRGFVDDLLASVDVLGRLSAASVERRGHEELARIAQGLAEPVGAEPIEPSAGGQAAAVSRPITPSARDQATAV